ncbi:hypothetical protein HDV03_000398 [Kappamyces sp. JEL0829]|nr:hypothetical protein HDV03_000398 [Kappamyces sp. JEL0829]
MPATHTMVLELTQPTRTRYSLLGHVVCLLAVRPPSIAKVVLLPHIKQDCFAASPLIRAVYTYVTLLIDRKPQPRLPGKELATNTDEAMWIDLLHQVQLCYKDIAVDQFMLKFATVSDKGKLRYLTLDLPSLYSPASRADLDSWLDSYAPGWKVEEGFVVPAPPPQPASAPRDLDHFARLVDLSLKVDLIEKPSLLFADEAASIWEQFVVVHQRLSHKIHNTAQFLPWHRAFLAIFDHYLATECGYTGPGVYWDWAVDSQAPDRSPVWNVLGKDPDGCISIPSLGNLTSTVPADVHPPGDRCVKRHWTTVKSSPALFGSTYSPEAIAFISQQQTYDAFRQALESGPHNNVASPNDPIFFLHHRNIDRLWWKWQQDRKETAFAYAGSTDNPSVNSTSGDIMTFLGMLGEFPVSEALDTTGNGVAGLMCYIYSNSVTSSQSAVVSKRDSALDDSTTPDSFDRAHLFNLRPPTVPTDAFLRAWMYSAADIAKIKSAHAQVVQFLNFLNGKPINYPTSLKNSQLGNRYGWVSKSDQQQAQEDADIRVLLAEYAAVFAY